MKAILCGFWPSDWRMTLPPVGPAARIKSFKLHAGDDVGVFPVAKQWHVVGQVNVKACGNNDCANFNVHFFRFLVKVDGLPFTANFGAFEAFNAVILVDRVNQAALSGQTALKLLCVCPSSCPIRWGTRLGKRLCIHRNPCIFLG